MMKKNGIKIFSSILGLLLLGSLSILMVISSMLSVNVEASSTDYTVLDNQSSMVVSKSNVDKGYKIGLNSQQSSDGSSLFILNDPLKVANIDDVFSFDMSIKFNPTPKTYNHRKIVFMFNEAKYDKTTGNPQTDKFVLNWQNDDSVVGTQFYITRDDDWCKDHYVVGECFANNYSQQFTTGNTPGNEGFVQNLGWTMSDYRYINLTLKNNLNDYTIKLTAYSAYTIGADNSGALNSISAVMTIPKANINNGKGFLSNPYFALQMLNTASANEAVTQEDHYVDIENIKSYNDNIRQINVEDIIVKGSQTKFVNFSELNFLYTKKDSTKDVIVPTVKFESSNPNLISINDETSKFEIHGEGKTYITARFSSGDIARFIINVEDETPPILSVNDMPTGKFNHSIITLPNPTELSDNSGIVNLKVEVTGKENCIPIKKTDGTYEFIPNMSGEYQVVYTASDESGNTTIISKPLMVIENVQKEWIPERVGDLDANKELKIALSDDEILLKGKIGAKSTKTGVNIVGKTKYSVRDNSQLSFDLKVKRDYSSGLNSYADNDANDQKRSIYFQVGGVRITFGTASHWGGKNARFDVYYGDDFINPKICAILDYPWAPTGNIVSITGIPQAECIKDYILGQNKTLINALNDGNALNITISADETHYYFELGKGGLTIMLEKNKVGSLNDVNLSFGMILSDGFFEAEVVGNNFVNGNVKSISYNQSTPLKLNYNDTTTSFPQLDIIEYPGKIYNISYTSSDMDIAPVDKNGNVSLTGRGAGLVTITATSDCGKIATYEIEVIGPKVTIKGEENIKEKLSKGTITLEINENIGEFYIKWISSDEEIATVKNGIITFKNIGEVRISVGAGEGMDFINLIITTSQVKVDQSVRKIIKFGEIQTLAYETSPSLRDCIITLSNDNVIKILKNGKIETLSIGIVTIKITANDNNEVYDEITIAVTLADILLEKDEIKLQLGENKKIGYATFPNDIEINFKSNDPSIAFVSNSGELTALKLGATKIILSHGNIIKTLDIIVSPKLLIDQKEFIVELGKEISINARTTTLSEKIIYTSLDESIATVNANGVVSAVKEGNVKIMITCGESFTYVDVITKKAIIENQGCKKNSLSAPTFLILACLAFAVIKFK